MFGRTIFHKILDLLDGYVQFPQKQDRLQHGALVIVIAAVAVDRVDGGRPEQADLVIPHERLFVDAMKSGELADGEQFSFFFHADSFREISETWAAADSTHQENI